MNTGIESKVQQLINDLERESAAYPKMRTIDVILMLKKIQKLSSPPTQEGEKEPIDAGRLFDENADCWENTTTWNTEFDYMEVGEKIPVMSKKKFIELYSKRLPDAGMEKIIDKK